MKKMLLGIGIVLCSWDCDAMEDQKDQKNPTTTIKPTITQQQYSAPENDIMFATIFGDNKKNKDQNGKNYIIEMQGGNHLPYDNFTSIHIEEFEAMSPFTHGWLPF